MLVYQYIEDMWILKFIRDLVIYPFDGDKKHNRFSNLLEAILKDYPAFLWIKPNIKKALIAPFLVVYYVFKKN